MKVIQEVNVSQQISPRVPINLPPGSLVGTNVSQYSASNSEFEDLESAKMWANEAEKSAIRSEEAADASRGFANDAGQSAVEASESAEASQGSSDTAKVWAEASQVSAEASEVSRLAAQDAQNKAEGYAADGLITLQDTIEIKDLAEVFKNAASASAAESVASAALAEQYKNTSKDNSDLAYQWAEGYPVNSSKYWAEQSMNAAASAIVSGGPFSPTVDAEYPNTTGVTVDTIYFITFSDEFQTYTFVTGQLGGKTTSAQDIMYWDVSESQWTLLRSPLSNSVMEVNGKTGNIITLVPSDIGAYTTSQVDAAISTRVPNTRLVNGKSLAKDIALGAADVGTFDSMEITNFLREKADKIITVNTYPLSANIVLDAEDVNARPDTWLPGINDLSGTIDFGTF